MGQSINQSVVPGDTKEGIVISQSQDSPRPGYGEKPKVPLKYGLESWWKRQRFKEIQELGFGDKWERVNSVLDLLSLGYLVPKEKLRGASKLYMDLPTDRGRGGLRWIQPATEGPLRGPGGHGWRGHSSLERGFSPDVMKTGMVLCQITPIKFPIIITNHHWKGTTDLTEQFATSISFSTSKIANSWSINQIMSIKRWQQFECWLLD